MINDVVLCDTLGCLVVFNPLESISVQSDGLGPMLPFMNFLPYFTGLKSLVIKYLRFTAQSTEVYNLYVLKKSVNVDNIGP
jgi:hypothetical protein